MEGIRILLADNNYIVRQGLRAILQGESQLEVASEACSGSEMYQVCSDQRVDVVMVDYTAVSFDLDDIRKLKETYPDLSLVAITEAAKRAQVQEAMQLGVKGHILKDCSHQEIIGSVEASHRGESFYCGKVLNVLNTDQEDARPLNCEPVTLSNREVEIIQKIAEGLTNRQVADALHLSAHTVTTHRKNIMNKLGVNNTAGLVVYAIRENLISPNKFLFNA